MSLVNSITDKERKKFLLAPNIVIGWVPSTKPVCCPFTAKVFWPSVHLLKLGRIFVMAIVVLKSFLQGSFTELFQFWIGRQLGRDFWVLISKIYKLTSRQLF